MYKMRKEENIISISIDYTYAVIVVLVLVLVMYFVKFRLRHCFDFIFFQNSKRKKLYCFILLVLLWSLKHERNFYKKWLLI